MGSHRHSEPSPHEIRIGTCGFTRRQREQVDELDFAEVRPGGDHAESVAIARRWRAAAPDGFEFTLKAPPAITHPPHRPAWRQVRPGATDGALGGAFRDTPHTRRAWKDTLELARALDASFVLFQSPHGFRPSDENVARLVRFFEWAHRDRIRLGWEPRHGAWTDDLVRRLCRELSLTHVVDPFAREPVRGRPTYFRLRGVESSGHRYADEELARLREVCLTPRPMCSPTLTYCVFSNTSMAGDARRFRQLVAKAHPADRP